MSSISYMASPSILMPPPTSTIMPFPRKRDPSTSPDESEAEEEEYQPGPSTKRVKKSGTSTTTSASTARGAGGSKGTKSSREALRKANHSLIERRRREKINFALGELRGMVPGLGEEKGGKAGEFKLEVLERTVEHMKDLKAEIIELEAKVAALGGKEKGSTSKRPAPQAESREEHRSKRKSTTTTSTTPPSPSLSPERQSRSQVISESPDPNETEPEAGLPPPFTVASRQSSHPSITSLLNSSNAAQEHHVRRPAPPPEATNPTLYLPFPTPSPTSPFLTYAPSNSSTSTSLATMEPSPFIAPLNNFSLFGGAISFDNPSPEVNMAKPQTGPPEISMPPPKEKRMPSPEEAANLLLAFSSPDTLRPVHGGTPVFAPSVGGRRGTLDGDDFMLDGNGNGHGHGHGRGGAIGPRGHTHGPGPWPREMVGKTAKDFLRM